MSLSLSPTGLVETLRAVSRRALYVGSVGLALAGFLVLNHGRGMGANGNAVAYVEAVHYSIAPTALGRIDQVLVRVGQRVNRGQPLALMEDCELSAARDKAQAELSKLQADVEARARDEELQVTRGELSLLKVRSGEQGERAQLGEIVGTIQRLDALLAQQMIPAAEVESARVKQKQLAARLAAVDHAKLHGQAGLDQGPANAGDHDDAVRVLVEPARRAVAVQETVLRQIELQIARLTLHAPVDGTVTSLARQPGEVVGAGTEVLALVSGRPGVLVAELQEGMAARVQVGRGVTVRLKDSFSSALHGRIIELAPEVDEVFVRARPSPGIAAWGRRAAVQLDEGSSDALPGQAFSVALD